MNNRIPVLFLILFNFAAQAQWDDTDRLTKEFHAGRRAALRQMMPEKSVAVFFANPVRNRANDVDYQYSQDPNFYYLTGYLEPNSVLVIFKEEQLINGQLSNELIFVQESNPKAEIWTGKRLGKEGVQKMLGFKAAFNNSEFEKTELPLKTFKRVLVQFPDQPNFSRNEKTDLRRLVRYFKEKTESENVKTDEDELSGMLAQLREVKQEEEMALLRKAIDITCEGFAEMIKAVQPGFKEYEAQAIVEYHFKKNGSEYEGYGSICGGGNNSCVLHYVFNRKELLPEDMLLVDMGAEYHGYTADVTRTIPVDGRYSPEERAIYQLVYDGQEAGIKACKPGNSFQAPHEAAKNVIANGLVELGIIRDVSEYSKYFMHGTSHYLGLDVHDAGSYGALKPNSVITVEPGIYIPEGSNCDPKWWKIGVRIEDDVLITETGYEVLSGSLAKTIVDIEKLMAEKSIFNTINQPLH